MKLPDTGYVSRQFMLELLAIKDGEIDFLTKRIKELEDILSTRH